MKKEKQEKQEKKAISKAKIVMGLVATLLLIAVIATVSVMVVKNKQQDDLNSNTNVTGEIFTVAFESNGGSAVDSLVGIAKGNKIVKPASPTKPSFSFVGWYKDAELLTEYIFETDVVNTNFTLYAKWKEKAAHVHTFSEWVETETGATRECTVCHHKEDVTYTVGLQYGDVDVDGTKVYMVTGIGTATAAKIICIPKIHDGKPVEGIGLHAFFDCTSFVSIIIPSSVISIGQQAFNVCPNLETVTFAAGSKLASIGNNAFWGCTNLTTVTFAADSKLTSIGSTAFCFCRSLASITIPSSVTSIADDAFDYCTALVSITVDPANANYQSIEGNLYNKAGTTLLLYAPGKTDNSITIPSSVTSIGNNAFNGCTKLATVTFEAGSKLTSIENYVFDGCTALAAITIPSGVASIGERAFRGCTKLATVTFAAGSQLTSIGRYAFNGCTALTSIIIPSGVTSIENDVFKECTNLATVTFEAGSLLTRIWYSAFEGCTALTSIIIPSGVTRIEERAFDGCTNLATVTFAADSKLIAIGNRAFSGCTSLAAIIIPSSVTRIEGSTYDDSGAFRDCTKLETVTFEAGSLLASIGQSAFNGCTALAAIIIPSGVTGIERDAFYSCINLATVTFAAGSKLTSIGGRAFRACISLAAITIPSSVTSIGSWAFWNCTALIIYAEAAGQPSGWNSDWNNSNCLVVWNCNTNDVATDGYIYTIQDGVRYGIKNGAAMVAGQPRTITTANIPASIPYKETTYAVTSIGGSAFYGCTSLTSITIPSSVTSMGDGAFGGCPLLANIEVDPANANYLSIEGNLYNKAGTTLLQYAVGKTAISFTIPSSVTSIDGRAFDGCTSLTSVTIPSSVTSIDGRAFDGCTSLTSITIPSSVTSIGYEAFNGCTSLTAITIPSSVTSIWGRAFSGCTSLASVTIPSSVTSIEWAAFYDCTALTIYAEAAGQPSGWSVHWNNSGRSVEWAQNNITTNVDYDYTVHNNQVYLTKYKGRSLAVVVPEMIDGKPVVSVGGTFGGAQITSISLPSGVTSIGDRTFCYCKNLATVTFAAGSQLTSIGYEAFNCCTSLTAITIPSSVTSIGNNAFAYCASLTSIIIPSSVTSIGDEAFQYCTALASITIPSSVTSIMGEAFRGCTKLATVTFEAGSKLTSIGEYAFSGCTSLAAITIPSSVTSIGDRAFNDCTALANIVVDSANVNYQSIDGNLYDKAGTTLLLYAPGKTATSYTILSSVTSIGWQAFQDCISLVDITIPSSVTSIGGYAFYGCTALTIYAEAAGQPSGWDSNWNYSGRPVEWAHNNITTNVDYDYTVHNDQVYLTKYKGSSLAVVVPEAIDGKPVVFVGEIFAGKQITSISLPSGATSIGSRAFYGCSNLATVTFAAGSKLTSIGGSAFDGCTALTSIIIPSSVTSIGGYAFSRCTSLTIYAEAAGEPSGWESYWNSSNRPVYWYRETATTGSGYWHYVGGVPTMW